MNGSMYLAYPFSVGSLGIPKTTGTEQHIRDLILSVLFTNPGERVNLPTFGAGIGRLVFAPNGSALITTAQFLITTNLQRWLGNLIDTQQVVISSDPGYEEQVTVEIVYVIKATGQTSSLQVTT